MIIIVRRIFLLLAYLHLCLQCASGKLYYEKMHDGTFLIAIPQSMAKDHAQVKSELAKYFHMPKNNFNNKHQNIDFTIYPKIQEQVNIGSSKDKQYLLKLKDFCIGQAHGQTRLHKLQNFKKGPCSPVVIVPGILATSLILTIDCLKLQAYNNGQIFNDCGWDTCSSLGISRPQSNYLLWVGLELSLKVTRGYPKCFGDLFGILYDSNSTAQFSSRYSTASGLKSTWFGNDDDSSDYSDCGANAIRDLSGYVSVLSVMGSQCALNDFGRLLDILKVMGYQSGLTLQAIPYDFRYGIQASSTPKLFPQVVKNLYYATGKKVVVIGHSLGTLHTLSGLAFTLTQQQKDKMIRHYIPITPPWLGTVSAIRNMVYGDPSYFAKGVFDLKTGINRYAQMKFVTTAGSSYDLFLKDAFHRFKDEPWMKQVVQRIKYQKQPRKSQMINKKNVDLQNGQQSYPLPWFPSKYQQCFPRYFKKNFYCEMGFVNFLQQPIFQINGTQYFGSEEGITKLITENLDQQKAKSALSLWAQTKVQGKTLRDMPAPGVDTSIIFTTLYDTQVYYKYKQKPKNDSIEFNQFIEPVQIINSPGDVSVPSWSVLLFASKWIHNRTNGDRQVNVIQYCSNYSKPRKHYSSLPCECSRNPFKNQLDCTHPCIISDKYIISFVLGILTNKKKGYGESTSDAVQFTEKQIQKRVTKCLNLQFNNLLFRGRPG